jgi:hypothetical protein
VVGIDDGLYRRSTGVKKPVTGDIKTIILIMTIIIIISPKSCYK